MASSHQSSNKTFANRKGAIPKTPVRTAKHGERSKKRAEAFHGSTRNSSYQKEKSRILKIASGKIKLENKVDNNRNISFNASIMRTNDEILTTRALVNLFKKSETEVLYSLLGDNVFIELLNKSEYEPELMVSILNVFRKASEASQPSNVSKLIHEIFSCHNFLTQVQLYILHYHRTSLKEINIEALTNFLLLLNKFQSFEPSNSVDTVIVLLPLLEQSCDVLTSKGINIRTIRDLLFGIKKQNDYVTESFNKFKSRNGIVELAPPNDFRSLSIIPTVDDIKEVNTFIRPNIIEGKYANTEHYLDVQFRLLREDYMRPLRLGIQHYLYLTATKELTSKTLKNMQNVKFYQDFKVLYPKIDATGVLYLASFDVTHLQNVNWDCTKRFMSGSLLCFSNDNFDTVFFASVAQREVKDLKHGFILIKLEESCEDLKCGVTDLSYVMIETEAYFEAYRHNLGALKQMNESNMPLQDYIVQVKKDIMHPSYVRVSTVYKMFSKSIPILNYGKWPTREQFGFDESQYKAFKAAITKEFCVIQGPPGTGKTFIALEITKMLLENINCLSNSPPILVVCYTNHALDQFLEGMLSYTRKIARVGGRCSNDSLLSYQLKNLRAEHRKSSYVPNFVREMIRKKYSELNSYVERMKEFNGMFDACFTNILQDTLLFNIMNKEHYFSLISVISNLGSYDGNLIKDWLALRSNTISAMSLLQDEKNSNLFTECNIPEDQLNLNTEIFETVTDNELDIRDSEVHFIEEARMIDDDDNDVCVKLGALQVKNSEVTEGIQEKWIKYSGKNQKKFIRNKLKLTKAMQPDEVYKVTDVWKLSLEKRWSLYVYWVQAFMNRINPDIFVNKQHILNLQAQLQEIRNVENVHILKKCNIVGITTTGAAKYKDMVKALQPQIVIFEEAAEVLEAHVVTSLTEDTKHVILIGDHQQLRPNPAVYELARKYNFDVSLFERMVKNGLECHKLTFQHRMRPSIANLLVPHIYPDLKNHPSVLSYDNIKGVDKNLFFITHNVLETENSELKSHANVHEAKFILALAKYLILQGYKSTQITILTTYSGQLFLLKKMTLQNELLSGVRITIVDNYQGEENDIILISFVRSNKHGGVGFLKISNRVCVSLSRAKQGLYCIGNFELLGKSCNLWKEIQAKLVSGKNIGSALKLNCQLHPDASVQVLKAEDFDEVPDGGCFRPCGKELECGHICIKKCHPIDLEHLEYKCMEPCQKILCENEHRCPAFCYQKCRPCRVSMSKVVPHCGHENKMPCCVDPDQWCCNTACLKVLTCGHECSSTCGKCKFFCLKCEVKINVHASCGHNVTIRCYNKSDLHAIQDACNIPCKETLNCGHSCEGNCRTCVKLVGIGIRVKDHVQCRKRCGKIMKCGHACRKLCQVVCRCDEEVEKTYSCGHSANVKCSDFSSSKCNNLCRAVLLCGHICLGTCTKCQNSKNHILCEEKVKHTLDCGHTMNLPCSNIELSLCQKMCAKNLPCGHKCHNQCCDPCEVECKAIVNVRKLCGHIEPSLCFKRNKQCEACLHPLLALPCEADLDLKEEFDNGQFRSYRGFDVKYKADSDMSDEYDYDESFSCRDLDFCDYSD